MPPCRQACLQALVAVPLRLSVSHQDHLYRGCSIAKYYIWLAAGEPGQRRQPDRRRPAAAATTHCRDARSPRRPSQTAGRAPLLAAAAPAARDARTPCATHTQARLLNGLKDSVATDGQRASRGLNAMQACCARTAAATRSGASTAWGSYLVADHSHGMLEDKVIICTFCRGVRAPHVQAQQGRQRVATHCLQLKAQGPHVQRGPTQQQGGATHASQPLGGGMPCSCGCCPGANACCCCCCSCSCAAAGMGNIGRGGCMPGGIPGGTRPGGNSIGCCAPGGSAPCRPGGIMPAASAARCACITAACCACRCMKAAGETQPAASA